MRLSLLLLGIIFCMPLFGQESGIIGFEEKMDLHRRLPEDRQQYKDMIPQFRTSMFELHFTSEESIYIPSKEQQQEEVSGDREGRMMRFRGPGFQDREVYKNLPENRLVDSRDFMDKKFLIKGALDEYTWKIDEGQQELLGYICLKAVYQDTSNTYTAWFTPQIPVSNGPADYAGLPGMILMVDMNDGERTITAISIEATEVDRDILNEPKKGKEVTSEEYRAIVREKMKEMRGQHGGGPGSHMMIIRQ